MPGYLCVLRKTYMYDVNAQNVGLPLPQTKEGGDGNIFIPPMTVVIWSLGDECRNVRAKMEIRAPEGKVLKAYLIDINPFSSGLIRHVIIDQFGMIFVPGYAWCNLQDSYRIIVLPNPVDRGNCQMGWDWDGWWEKNWQCDSWAWCYSRKMPQFYPCYVQHESDGNQVIYGA